MKRNISLIALAIVGFCVQANAQTVNQTNVTPITGALNKVVQLTPVTFNYDLNWAEKLTIKPGQQNGLDLDNLAKISPELIVNEQRNYTAGKNNTKSVIVPKVNYEALVPLLVGSIKEQQRQIEALKAELDSLKGQRAK